MIMKWNAFFHGRNVGAIGKSYWIKYDVEGASHEEATNNLYKLFEDIHWLTLDPAQQLGIPNPQHISPLT
jgi:hypothetical protein